MWFTAGDIEVSMDSSGERLRATGLFAGLSEAEFAAVCGRVERVELAPGELAVREGDPADALMVVESGTAQVFGFSREGAEIVLAKLGPGAYFGEQALSRDEGERAPAHVRAFSRMAVLKLTRAAFHGALAQGSPHLPRPAEAAMQPLSQLFSSQSVLVRSISLGKPDGMARRERFADGEVVFRDGDPAERFYVVIDGSASVWVNEGGREERVVTLAPGQTFGELGVLRRQPRTETVKAEGDLMLLSIDGRRFLDATASSPELQEFIQTLDKVYLLKGHGFTTRHAGKLDGMQAVTTLYHLTDGRRLVGTRVLGREVYSLSVAGADVSAATTARWRDEATGAERELVVAGTQALGLTVRGAWDELGEVHAYFLDKKPLEPWQLEVFRTRGTLRLEEDPTFFQDSEVVCACMQVTRGALRAALRAGAADHAALSEKTGAGTVCGGCIPRLREMVGRPDWTLVACTEVIPWTPEIRSFRFRPLAGELKPARPGQHIVLQARIDDRWVQRPYTLSSSATETGYYEITVKRESRGVFSGWLFDQMRPDALVRISSPQGTYCLEDNDRRPAACFVAGIGVTPAVAMVRSLSAGASRRRIHVDYSFARAEQAAFLAELQAAAAEHPAVTVWARGTRTEGRVTAADVAHAVDELTVRAAFYVCGPGTFQSEVVAHLAAAGVPAERIHVEEFTAAGGRPETGVPGQLGAGQGHPAKPRPSGEPPGPRPGEKPAVPEVLAAQPVSVDEEARAYLRRFFHEKGVPAAFEPRMREVAAQIRATGTYAQTYDELAFGAKLAWRNSSRCIGRLFWHGLQVRDFRHVTDPDPMFRAVCEHIQLATNAGNLRAVMTVFPAREPGKPGLRLWNPQLIRYAGYRQPDGTWIGDPSNAELTEAVLKLGWDPGPRTHFDILPLVFQWEGQAPRMYTLPRDLVLEVPLSHPDLPWFASLGLKWYALPAVSEMLFDCGGVQYGCAPFNGWYMGTEIGARNFSDEYRYNMLPAIARRMGLNTSRDRTLWKDRALVELNLAVLYSFELAGVKMSDHHAASNDFLEFARAEAAAGRRVDARWDWLVPPISGSLSPLFHVDWVETVVKPNYFYQPRAF